MPATPRPLGTALPAVFPIGLGCMGMSEFYGPADDAESLATLAHALERGVQLFDTADTYGLGANEALLGRFIADGGRARRERMVLATKFGIVRASGAYERRLDNSPAYIRAACEASLKRLGVERIDLYYCHRRDPAVPIEDVVGAMAELVAAGKVRALGLSEVSADTLRRAHAVHPIAALQSEYSLWTREPEREMLPLCAELGTAFVAYSPLGRAFLTGALDTARLAADDFRAHNPRFQGAAAQANTALVDALGDLARDWGLTSAQLALAWLLHRQPHVLPIPGTRRRARLDENVSAAAITLDAGQMARIQAVLDAHPVQGARYPDAGWAGVEAKNT
ncbi:MAG: aldo/keto reductase [Ottowia sp.]|uniref:aldo/keto reductase n=1 Tax=Ottowia sp. TaxID=1898956 RepID=UPI0039E4F00A